MREKGGYTRIKGCSDTVFQRLRFEDLNAFTGAKLLAQNCQYTDGLHRCLKTEHLDYGRLVDYLLEGAFTAVCSATLVIWQTVAPNRLGEAVLLTARVVWYHPYANLTDE